MNKGTLFAIGLDLIIIPSVSAIAKLKFAETIVLSVIVGIGTEFIGQAVFEEKE